MKECKTCFYWIACDTRRTGVQDHNGNLRVDGDCRIGPPELGRTGDQPFRGRWPITVDIEGCHAWQPKEGTPDETDDLDAAY